MTEDARGGAEGAYRRRGRRGGPGEGGRSMAAALWRVVCGWAAGWGSGRFGGRGWREWGG